MHPLPSSRDSAVVKRNLELPWSWSLDCDDSEVHKPNLLVFSKLFWSRESSGMITITLPWRSSGAHWYVRLFPKPVGAQKITSEPPRNVFITSTCSCFAEYPAICAILAAKDIALLTSAVQSVYSWCWKQTGTNWKVELIFSNQCFCSLNVYIWWLDKCHSQNNTVDCVQLSISQTKRQLKNILQREDNSFWRATNSQYFLQK